MLRMLDRFRSRFARLGLEVEAPDVVQTLTEAELLARVPGVEGWIIGDDPATRRVFEAGRAGRLRAAVKWGVGVDNVDFVAAQACGIPITNTPHAFGAEVADVAMAYVTMLARDLVAIDRGVRAGQWPKPAGTSLAGQVAGLVGYGDIGCQIARRLLVAGMQVLVYDPSEPAAPPETRLARWPERLESCDFLVFACSLNAENRHMLDAATLGRCRPGVRIINVARGPLIEEAALVEALRTGRVRGAALDVFEEEPLPAGSPLREMEQVILGSHNGSNTVEAVVRTSDRAIDLLAGFLDLKETGQ